MLLCVECDEARILRDRYNRKQGAVMTDTSLMDRVELPTPAGVTVLQLSDLNLPDVEAQGSLLVAQEPGRAERRESHTLQLAEVASSVESAWQSASRAVDFARRALWRRDALRGRKHAPSASRLPPPRTKEGSTAAQRSAKGRRRSSVGSGVQSFHNVNKTAAQENPRSSQVRAAPRPRSHIASPPHLPSQARSTNSSGVANLAMSEMQVKHMWKVMMGNSPGLEVRPDPCAFMFPARP